jgi:hypothetical protein
MAELHPVNAELAPAEELIRLRAQIEALAEETSESIERLNARVDALGRGRCEAAGPEAS